MAGLVNASPELVCSERVSPERNHRLRRQEWDDAGNYLHHDDIDM
jgi:hypothetical protein